MCGFGLIVERSDRVEEAALGRMGDSMEVRGPDAVGHWVSPNGRVGMVHRRLAIIDLSSSANQPMRADDGTVVSFNGEIYNFHELRRELEAAGHEFHTHSDTEVLLHGYRQWGPELPARLVGMFAFAIWDPRDGSTFLARDHFGIKPLYFHARSGRVIAASTTSAILASGLVAKEFCDAGVASFFLWGSVSDPFTVYEGIESLPAGHAMRIDIGGQVWRRQYWSVTDCLAAAEAAPTTIRAEATELLRASLSGAVRRHLMADVPVGFFLSSGRDSSALVGLAAELGTDVRALTLGFREFEGQTKDEVPLAREVARFYGSNHQVVWTTKEQFHEHESRFFANMDQPTIDGINTYFVSKAAADAGLKVVISGLGADELLGGYPSFVQVPSLVNMVQRASLPVGLGSLVRKVLAPVMGHVASPKYAGVLEYGNSWGGAYQLRRSLHMPWELYQRMGKPRAKRALDRLQATMTSNALAEPLHGEHAKMVALETSLYMRNTLLRDSDWASMAHSLELRVPFVDVALFEALAPALVHANGSRHPTKADLSLCPNPPLPAAVAERPKTGFEVPVRQWLHSEDASAGRGLRGWADFVAERFGLPVEPPQARRKTALQLV